MVRGRVGYDVRVQRGYGEGANRITVGIQKELPTKLLSEALLLILAEREGFEPPEPLSSSVFKTGAIDHSATFPSAKV